MIDLLPRHLEMVRRILDAHLPGVEVKVFGSRATGKAQPYSDLDLALIGKERVPRETLSRMEDAFSESDLPFRVDLVDWNRVSPSFRKVIQATWVPLPNPEDS